jgi:adenine-specific DNA-methyltransferase
LDQVEDYLSCAGIIDNGEMFNEEAGRRLFSLPATVTQHVNLSIEHPTLNKRTEKRQDAIRQRNAEFFEIEADKHDAWAEDLKVGLEREIKEFDRQIKEARKTAVVALTFEEKLACQKQIKAIEAERGKRRRTLFEAQDEIDRRREQLISEIEGKLQQKISSQQLFAIRWHVRQ